MCNFTQNILLIICSLIYKNIIFENSKKILRISVKLMFKPNEFSKSEYEFVSIDELNQKI